MDTPFTKFFTQRWQQYFAGAELPIGYFYADQVREEDLRESTDEERCLIGNLNRVRAGFPFVYSATSPGCIGGKRYSGFSEKLRPKFEYFLSCGIPGEMEGERYKKSPGLVKDIAHKLSVMSMENSIRTKYFGAEAWHFVLLQRVYDKTFALTCD